MDREISRYVEAYAQFIQPRIARKLKDTSTQKAGQMLKAELEAFQRSTDPDFTANPTEPVFPLLEGDRQVMGILSRLTTENLSRYIRIYKK